MLAKASIGVAEIQKLEKLTVSDEELQDELQKLEEELKASGEASDIDGLKQMVKERLESKLVFQWIQNNCEVSYI